MLTFTIVVTEGLAQRIWMEMLNVMDQNKIGEFHVMKYANKLHTGDFPQWPVKIKNNVSNQ